MIMENNRDREEPKNVYVADGGVISSTFLNKENKIASGSIVRLTVEKEEQEVFRYWDKDYIAEFNNFDEREVYLHQEIFKLDKGDTNKGFAIYKKGTDSKVALNVGSNYARLVFRTGKNAKDISPYIASTFFAIDR